MRSVAAVHRAAVLVALPLALCAARPARAQQTDPRWLAWLGCWERSDVLPSPDRRLACIVPADSGPAVEVVAIIGGRIINVERIEAPGAERAIDADGCTGSERTTWSADGARLFRSTDVECQGGLRQHISQLFAMTPDGSWLDIQGVSLPGGTGLRPLRYRATALLDGVPEAITARLTGLDGIARSQTTAAQAPVTTGVVAEAALHLQAPVVQVWLAELKQGFALNARELQALAAAGVPGEVIDIMVALSYPRAFRLEGNLQVTELRAGTAATVANAGSVVRYAGMPEQYLCDPRVDSYELYQLYRDRYCVYRSSYVNYLGVSNEWMWGYRPIITTADGSIVPGSGNSSRGPVPHGRVSSGGYQQDPGAAPTGRQAQPRDPANTGTNTATEQTASPGTGSPAPASPTPQRTAQPRQP